jgi:hypothetical protein
LFHEFVINIVIFPTRDKPFDVRLDLLLLISEISCHMRVVVVVVANRYIGKVDRGEGKIFKY